MYGDLVLEDRDRGDAPPELAAPVLAEKVVDGTLKLVKWNEDEKRVIEEIVDEGERSGHSARRG